MLRPCRVLWNPLAANGPCSPHAHGPRMVGIRMALPATGRPFWHCGAHTAKPPKFGAYPPTPDYQTLLLSLARGSEYANAATVLSGRTVLCTHDDVGVGVPREVTAQPPVQQLRLDTPKSGGLTISKLRTRFILQPTKKKLCASRQVAGSEQGAGPPFRRTPSTRHCALHPDSTRTPLHHSRGREGRGKAWPQVLKASA